MIDLPEITEVASYDLYDTLVTRRSLSTRTLYALVWDSLSSRGCAVPDCTAFIDQRERADVASKHLDAPTLSQILEYLDDPLRDQASAIESAETEIELGQLQLVPGALRQVCSARESGKKIAFVSDMHIGAHNLQGRLSELGLFKAGDILCVSSDHGVSKSRHGNLFKHLMHSHNLSSKCITHAGNNEWSDVRMARKHGVSAVLCPAANLNRFETILTECARDSAELEEIAALSRDTRLSISDHGGRASDEIDWQKESLCQVASSVAAPVLVAYVTWVIEQCRQDSISTIRFLARDGELLYLIARSLPDEITDGLDLGMLEVSRRSLMLPAASLIPLDDWLDTGLKARSYLELQYDLLPAAQLVSRVGLSFNEHPDMLARFGIVDPERPLGKEGLANWKSALNDAEVRQEISRVSHSRLAVTSDYLRQQLNGSDGSRIALVDVGWTGQQAAMLSALIRNLDEQDPLHLHIGRLRDRCLVTNADLRHWLFDEREAPSQIENPVALIETFCATLLGGVDGYQYQQDGSVIAVKRHQHAEQLLSWGQPLVRQCVLEFARVAGKVMQNVDADTMKGVCKELLKAFWETPTREEARSWGAFPYEQDQAGAAIKKLAGPYNLARFKSRLNGSHSGIDWKSGSIALSPSPVRQLLALRQKFRR